MPRDLEDPTFRKPTASPSSGRRDLCTEAAVVQYTVRPHGPDDGDATVVRNVEPSKPLDTAVLLEKPFLRGS